MSLDLKSVEFFIRVAALGAIGKAGAEFGYSATAASQRIQNLEHALGAKLLNRTTRSVSLTRDGELFLNHAKKIIADVEDAVTDLQGTGKIIKGELRVTASASFGRRYIAPFIGEFLKQHPEVSIQLELSDSMFDIVRHGFDLALRIGVLEPSTLLAKKIADSPRLLVASKDYVNKYGMPKVAEDLVSHNCLLLGDMRLWQLRNEAGKLSEIKISGNFSTNLTRLSLNYRINTFDEDNYPLQSHSFTIAYQIYHNRFLGVFQFGGYNPEDINIYGRHQIEAWYEFTSHLKNMRYSLTQRVFLHPDVHPSAEIYRSETSATLYPWDGDLGIMARFSFGFDDYNYRFVDSYPRFSVGLTWDWFTPFVVKPRKMQVPQQ